MCRILAARAWTREGVETLRGVLASSFLRAAERDPRLLEYAGAWSHCDGHGYVLLVDRGGGWEISYHRYDAAERYPGYEEACRANLEALKGSISALQGGLGGAERAVLVLHARKASRGTPRGSLHAHPYHVTATRREGVVEIFLAHNGSVRAGEIARDLGTSEAGLTDSYLLALWIARQAGARSVEEAIEEAATFTRSALVLAILALEPLEGGGLRERLLYSNIYRRAEEYYRGVILEAEGLRAFASPTVADYAVESGALALGDAGARGEL